MPGFDHHPSPAAVEEPVNVRSARYGRWLFLGYLLLYGAFVLLNAFDPQIMEKTPWGGVNLAILFGLGLIAAAFLLALVYDWICRFTADTSGDRKAGQ